MLIYFQIYGVRKMWLDKCLKRPASEQPLTVNMLKGTKRLLNLHGSTSLIFSITLSEIDLESISLSDM